MVAVATYAQWGTQYSGAAQRRAAWGDVERGADESHEVSLHYAPTQSKEITNNPIIFNSFAFVFCSLIIKIPLSDERQK